MSTDRSLAPPSEWALMPPMSAPVERSLLTSDDYRGTDLAGLEASIKCKKSSDCPGSKVCVGGICLNAPGTG